MGCVQGAPETQEMVLIGDTLRHLGKMTRRAQFNLHMLTSEFRGPLISTASALIARQIRLVRSKCKKLWKNLQ